jgi:hypothetical protein
MTWETKKDQWKDWTKEPKGVYTKLFGDYKVVAKFGFFYLHDRQTDMCFGSGGTLKECLQYADPECLKGSIADNRPTGRKVGTTSGNLVANDHPSRDED